MEPFLLEVLTKFGFPVFCTVIVAWGLWNTFRDRIRALEALASMQGEKIGTLQDDRLRRAEQSAETMRTVLNQVSSAIREQSKVARDYQRVIVEQHQIMKRLLDAIQTNRLEVPAAPIRHNTPSSTELPPVPPAPEGSGTDLYPQSTF